MKVEPNDSPEFRALVVAYEAERTQQRAQVLADFLEEQGDERAADVRHLADVVPVIPDTIPQQQYVNEPLVPPAYQAYPMAVGPWWTITRFPGRVNYTSHDSPKWHAVDPVLDRGFDEEWDGTVQDDRGEAEPLSPSRVLQLFEVARSRLLLAVLELTFREARDLAEQPAAA